LSGPFCPLLLLLVCAVFWRPFDKDLLHLAYMQLLYRFCLAVWQARLEQIPCCCLEHTQGTSQHTCVKHHLNPTAAAAAAAVGEGSGGCGCGLQQQAHLAVRPGPQNPADGAVELQLQA
jgi:hypothetical protein